MILLKKKFISVLFAISITILIGGFWLFRNIILLHSLSQSVNDPHRIILCRLFDPSIYHLTPVSLSYEIPCLCISIIYYFLTITNIKRKCLAIFVATTLLVFLANPDGIFNEECYNVRFAMCIMNMVILSVIDVYCKIKGE